MSQRLKEHRYFCKAQLWQYRQASLAIRHCFSGLGFSQKNERRFIKSRLNQSEIGVLVSSGLMILILSNNEGKLYQETKVGIQTEYVLKNTVKMRHSLTSNKKGKKTLFCLLRPLGNFSNVLTSSFYIHKSKKHQKLLELTVFLALLGSACVKAACKHVGEIDPRFRFYKRTLLLFLIQFVVLQISQKFKVKVTFPPTPPLLTSAQSFLFLAPCHSTMLYAFERAKRPQFSTE